MKKHGFTILVVGLIVGSLILIAVLQATRSTTRDMEPVEGQELVYQGNENAENELLFLFDYACHWCTLWVDDVYPIIEANYIDTGEMMFRTQAMTYVNDASQRLANFDENVKNHAPEQYHEIFHHIVADTSPDTVEIANWGSDDYIDELIEVYQLDGELMTAPAELGAAQLSQTYSQALNVDVVPTIYVNGNKVEDAYDLEEIDGLLH